MAWGAGPGQDNLPEIDPEEAVGFVLAVVVVAVIWALWRLVA